MAMDRGHTMAMLYSGSVRKHVIEAVEADMSHREAAERFEVSSSSWQSNGCNSDAMAEFLRRRGSSSHTRSVASQPELSISQ